MKQYWVYILHCNDGTYYVGITSNVDVRVAEHERGVDAECYTYFRRPLRLVHAEVFSNPEEAILCEKRIKGWSRAKKEALMRGDWLAIRRLARASRLGEVAAKGHPSTSSA